MRMEFTTPQLDADRHGGAWQTGCRWQSCRKGVPSCVQGGVWWMDRCPATQGCGGAVSPAAPIQRGKAQGRERAARTRRDALEGWGPAQRLLKWISPLSCSDLSVRSIRSLARFSSIHFVSHCWYRCWSDSVHCSFSRVCSTSLASRLLYL
eukprot:EG_transcript_30704